MAEVQDRSFAGSLIATGGETGRLIATHAWSATALGPMDAWPQSLRTMLDVLLRSPVPLVLLWGEDGVMLYNDAYSVFAGGRHPDLLGSKVREGWPEVAAFNDNVMRVGLAGGTLSYRDQELTLYRHGRPEQVWMNLDYSPVLDDAGRPAGVICVLAETSDRVAAERKRQAAEAQLRESEARLRLMADAVPQIIWTTDAEGRLEFFNRQWADYMGAPAPAATAGDVATGYVHPDDAAPTMAAFEEARRTGGVFEVEHRIRSTTGHYRWFLVRAEPYRDPVSGEIVRWFGTSVDIHERRQAEAVLRSSEERLRFFDRLTASTQSLADPTEIMAVTARLVGEHLKASICAYADMDEDQDGFTIRGDWAAPGSASIVGRYSLADFGKLAVKNLSAGLPLVIDDNRRELAPEEAATFQNIGIAATICMPLVKAGRLTALMAVHDGVPRVWTEAELSVLREVTARSWAHIERVATVAALRAKEARQRFRVELNDALRGLAAPADIMGAVAERLGPHLGVDQANYYLVEGDRFTIIAEWRTDESPGLLGSHSMADFGEATVALLRAGEILRLNDTRGATGADAYAAAGIAAVLSAPLRSGGAWAGGLHVHQARPRTWTDEEAALLAEVAERAWAEIERARAEAELRENEERLRLVQAAGGVGSFDYDLVRDVAVCSPEYFELLGLPRDHPINRETWAGAIHPEDRHEAIAALDRAIADRAPFDYEYRIVRADDGAVRWLSGKAAVVFDSQNRPWRYVGGNIDVTDRRMTEDQLRELTETLEDRVAERTAERDRVWTNSRDLLLVLGTDGVFQAVNPAWTALLGYRPDELVGRNVVDLVLPEDSGTTAGALDKAAAERDLTSFENRYVHKDGSVRWISWRTVTEGNLIYAYGRDVTADKTREAELEAAQEALRHAQKMEAMGQLTGGVAHDFNNLLTPIIGSLDMLVRRGVGSERERRLIDGALQSAERARTLVQRLLAFARRQPLQAVAVDMRALIDGMAGLIGSTLGPKIDIRVELADDLPPARADANQLEMALLNLAVNARDAMPDGGTLTIAAAHETVGPGQNPRLKRGPYVRLAVTDTGHGMDAATVARAVEPFFSTKGVGKGTGLGLSMVHGLAAQLGGALAIQSRPGVGTTVELWLPISTDRPDEAGDGQDAMPPVPARGRALLVDDEDLVRMSTADMLIDLGYDVVEAGSAEEALHLIRDGLPADLLVTDHLMPGMSGVDLARAARALKPKLPILIVSGYAEVEDIAPDLPRLTKPFRNAELAERLATLVPVAGVR